MTTLEQQRLNFCSKVFKAFGLKFTILVDHRVIYQVGDHWQCRNIDSLERKAEGLLRYRKKHG